MSLTQYYFKYSRDFSKLRSSNSICTSFLFLWFSEAVWAESCRLDGCHNTVNFLQILYAASQYCFKQGRGNTFHSNLAQDRLSIIKPHHLNPPKKIYPLLDRATAWHMNILPFVHQYFNNKLTVRFLMYKNTFWVCWGPLIISGKQAASWDVIRSCGSLLWKAAPSTPTIKRQVVYRQAKGTAEEASSHYSF